MKTYIVLWVAPDTWSKAPEEDAPSGNLLAPVPCCCSPAKLTERFDPVSDWLRLSWSFSSSASRSLGLLSLRGRRLLLEEVGAAAAEEEATVEDSPVKYFRSMLNIVAELNFSCVPSHFGRSSQWKRNHYVLQTSWNKHFLCDQLENCQALLWWTFQTAEILREMAALSCTLKYQAMWICNL